MIIFRVIIVLTSGGLLTSCTSSPTPATPASATQAPAAQARPAPASATPTPAKSTSALIEALPAEDLGSAPPFEAVDTAGIPVNNQTIKGKVIVLDFWATWCAPCIMGLPRMQALSERYKEAPDVEVIAVQVDEVGDARQFFADRKLTLRSIPSARPMAIAFAASGLPLKVVIGKDGRIKLRSFGSFANDEQRLSELIEALR